MTDSISRFNRTVGNYVKYRPHYPYTVVEFLQNACQSTSAMTVADIASGTGKSVYRAVSQSHGVV